MASKAKRSFGLSEQDVEALTGKYAKTKRFPNPYRSGAYAFTVNALISLGANKPHPLAKVHAAFKKAAGAEWYGEWVGAKKRNKKTGLDADGRFQQNLRVLQRTADYSLKLLEVGKRVIGSKGAVIDISRDSKGRLLASLNTDSDTPIKPPRSNAAVQVVRGPSVANRKATGGKGKGKAAAKRKTPQKSARTPRTATEAK